MASSAASAFLEGGFPCLPAYAASRGRPEPRRAALLRHPIGNSAPSGVQECLPAVHRLRLPASP